MTWRPELLLDPVRGLGAALAVEHARQPARDEDAVAARQLVVIGEDPVGRRRPRFRVSDELADEFAGGRSCAGACHSGRGDSSRRRHARPQPRRQARCRRTSPSSDGQALFDQRLCGSACRRPPKRRRARSRGRPGRAPCRCRQDRPRLPPSAWREPHGSCASNAIEPTRRWRSLCWSGVSLE